MSDYTKSTNFATKDNLSSGNALKIVKGTEIDTEFNNIATAIATKADLTSPTFTGTVTIPTVSISAGTISGITDLTVADGGTGASTAANARINLGLVIGTNVQAWDADLDTWATKTAPTGVVVGTTDTQTLTNKTLTSPTINSPTISSPTISGTPVMSSSLITSGTSIATTSGTSVTFTGIPSWAKRINVVFQGVQTNGSSYMTIQLGTSGGIVTSGYSSMGSACGNGGTWSNAGLTTAMILEGAGGSSYVRHGVATITNISGNIWVLSFTGAATTALIFLAGAGSISLASVLTQLKIVPLNATDTFTAGSINILYE